MTLEQYYKESREQHVNNIRRKLSVNKEEAEDIVQTAFLQAFVYFKNYDPSKGKIANWFSKILYRSFLNYKKKEIIYPTISNYNYIEDDVDYNLIVENRQSIEKLIKEYDNSNIRIVLECYFLKGYSSSELADFLPYKVENIRQICHRFRVKLKKECNIVL